MGYFTLVRLGSDSKPSLSRATSVNILQLGPEIPSPHWKSKTNLVHTEGSAQARLRISWASVKCPNTFLKLSDTFMYSCHLEWACQSDHAGIGCFMCWHPSGMKGHSCSNTLFIHTTSPFHQHHALYLYWHALCILTWLDVDPHEQTSHLRCLHLSVLYWSAFVTSCIISLVPRN